MHDACFSQMLQVKMENQREDVPDYIQIFGEGTDQDHSIQVKCEICLD